MDKVLIAIVLVCLIAGAGIGYALGHNVFPPTSKTSILEVPAFAYVNIAGYNCTATYGVLIPHQNQSTMLNTTVPMGGVNVSRPANYGSSGWWEIVIDGTILPFQSSSLHQGDYIAISVHAPNGMDVNAMAEYPSNGTTLICILHS